MPELLETAAIALAQDTVDDCPFPHKDEKHDRSNDFSNNAQTLGGNLGGGEDRSVAMVMRGERKPMTVGFQAHHLIPGAAIKGATALRKFMTAGDTVKADVGYEQNGKWNGTWLPGVHLFEGWAEVGRKGGGDIQFAYAYYAMDATGRQFHRWDSSHKDYNALVRRTLEEIRLKMVKLQSGCEECKKRSQKPWDPPYRLVKMLDSLAQRLQGRLTGGKNRWVRPYCTSDYAVLVGQGKTPD